MKTTTAAGAATTEAVSSAPRRYEPILEIATEVDPAEVDAQRLHGVLALMLARIHWRRQEAR